MNHYLVIKNVSIKCANALTSAYAISGAPVMAINLFAHNLGLKTKTPVTAIAIIHHKGQFLEEDDWASGFKRRAVQQRRAGSYINQRDYAAGGISISLQPTASVHLTVTLVLETTRQPRIAEIKKLIEAGVLGRIAGGQIESVGEITSFAEGEPGFTEALPASGFWLVERSDLMCLKNNPAEALVAALGTIPKRKTEHEDPEERPSWITATTLGYAATTPFEERTGVRMLSDETFPLHAYAEPLLGLIQYVSVRSVEAGQVPFWRTSWITENVYAAICDNSITPMTVKKD